MAPKKVSNVKNDASKTNKTSQVKNLASQPDIDSINYTYKYTIFDSIKLGFAGRYVLAFASFLNASAFQFSLVAAFPQFIGGFIQLFMGTYLRLFKSRKSLMIFVTIMQSLVWIPIIYIAFHQNYWTVWFYIILISFYTALTLITSPLWNSWTMDIVDPDRRGKYLAIRSKIIDVVGFLSFIAGGLILNRARTTGTGLDWSFAALFTVAVISNFIAARYIKKIDEPAYRYIRPKVSLGKFMATMRTNNQGNIVLYMSLMSFAVYISLAFFTPYMLKTLKFSYLQYAILSSFPFLIRIMFAKRFGRIIDRYGPKKMLRLVSFLFVFTPLLWLIDSSFGWLIFAQIYSGLAFSAYEISALTFLINQTDSKNRVSLFTYYNFFNGFFILAGALSANLIMNIGPYTNPYMNAFLFSGLLRLLILFIRFPKRVKEKDHYTPASYNNLSKQVFALDSTKEFLGKMVLAKETFALRPMDRNDIVTKLGNGAYLKIKKNNNIITNYTPRLPKKKIVEQKKPSHDIYLCRSCNAEFKRYVHSTTNLKCPYCSKTNLIFMRNEYKVNVYRGKKK